MEEEWAARQTVEDKFRKVAEGMTHLGPRSARRATPYLHLRVALTAT